MVLNWILRNLIRSEIHLLKTTVFLALIPLLTVSCASPTSLDNTPGPPRETVSQPATIQGTDVIPGGSGTATSTPSIEGLDEDDLERIFPTLPEGLERIDPTQGTPITGEAPADLLESIIEDLSGLEGIDSQQIEVVRAEAVVWPDGSLGCQDMGEFYTQEPVNGYWIILESGGTQYDYRAAESGYFKRCESPLPLVSPGAPEQ